MKDFTLDMYSEYLKAIKSTIGNFIRIDEYMTAHTKPDHFCIVRHDIDRRAYNALKIAKLEANLGIKAVYYFRSKPNIFKPDMIQEIESLGHEIGYHYECLSDTDGDINKAITLFEKNLEKFRDIVQVRTISMHGRAFKPYDNRDIWKSKKNHDLLINKFNILGEVYLDIDYSDIAYINDTGRNWTSNKSNRRDHVDSNISADFNSGKELLTYLSQEPHPKMIFQIHPERWTDKKLEHLIQFFIDEAGNTIKSFM